MTSDLRVSSATWLRRAFGELFLIVVGVSVALAFENWNTGRSDEAQERRLLLELSDDLEATREDLVRDIVSTTNGLGHLQQILDWIRGGDVPDSVLDRDFGVFSVSSKLFPERAAYESLKSIGLDRISSDSVRAGVTSIYELALTRVMSVEATRDEYIRDVTEPFVRSRFRYTGNRGLAEGSRLQVGGPALYAPMVPLTPLDRPGLRRDPAFEIMCRSLFNHHSDALSFYRLLDTDIGHALELLDAQLE